MHELDETLKHFGVKGMRWGVRRGEGSGKSKRTKSGTPKKTIRSPLKRARALTARLDASHVDAKTGEYSNNSTLAKSLRILDRTAGVAMVGGGSAGLLLMSDSKDDNLLHYGVKGMKWGVKRSASYNKGMKLGDRRKLKKMTTAEARQKYLDKKDEAWLNKVKDNTKAQKVAKRTASDMKKVNKQLKEEYGGTVKRTFDRQAQAGYQKAMKDAYDEILAGHTFAVYKLSPSRTREVEIKALSDGTMKATVVERDTPKLAKQRAAITKAADKAAKREASLTHADQSNSSDVDGMFFIITMDEDGFPDDVIAPFDTIEQNDDNVITTAHPLDDVLKHYGVKGMKWGKRSEEDSSKSEEESSGGGGGEPEDEDEDDMFDRIGDKIDELGDDLKKKGSKILESMFGKSKTKYTVIDTSKAKKILGMKKMKDKDNPFKNKSFQEEWKKREAARAKVDKLVNSGQLSSKDAKSMKKRIDEDAQKTLKRKESMKNAKIATTVVSINGKKVN